MAEQASIDDHSQPPPGYLHKERSTLVQFLGAFRGDLFFPMTLEPSYVLGHPHSNSLHALVGLSLGYFTALKTGVDVHGNRVWPKRGVSLKTVLKSWGRSVEDADTIIGSTIIFGDEKTVHLNLCTARTIERTKDNDVDMGMYNDTRRALLPRIELNFNHV